MRPSQTRRRPLALLAFIASAALFAGFATPTFADSKDDIRRERDGVDRQLADARADVHASSKRYQEANDRLARAESQLKSARQELDATRGQLVVAQAEDERLRGELAKAESRLTAAEKDVRSAEKKLNVSSSEVEAFAVESIMQGDTGLRAFGGLLAGDDPMQFSEKMSVSTSMSDAQVATMQQLAAGRVLLEVERGKLEDLRNQVADQKAESERLVATMAALTAAAEEQEASIKSLVTERGSAQGEAKDALREDQAQQAALESERDALSRRLQAIIDEELRKQQQQKPGNGGGGSSGGGGGGATKPPTGDQGSTLSRPVSGRITSPYGMRVHPITGVYKLHDGTDFAASCGTPIRAAASGTVVEQYYNAGYGNRVILNNGVKRGVSVITTYNHLSRFAVSRGTKVSRGQVIGYVGTTGYSTGCHLHFMVLVNGKTTNPMGWL